MQRALELAGAPEALIAWVEERDMLEPWHVCESGEWLLWLVACGGLPLDDLIVALRVSLEATIGGLPPAGAAPLRGLLARLESGDLDGIATELDELEAGVEGGTHYRGGKSYTQTHATRAVAFLGRACVALTAVIDQVADERIREAIAHGTAPAAIGGAVLAPHLMATDPRQHTLGFVVMAVTEAAHETTLALAGRDDEAAIAEADAELAERLRHLLAL